MPDIKTLVILSVKCSTIQPGRHMWEMNEQSTDDMSCTNENSNDNPTFSSKNKYKIEYSIAETGNEADMKLSAAITQPIHSEF